jgi:transcriptional regulator with XRE-family HTH domain
MGRKLGTVTKRPYSEDEFEDEDEFEEYVRESLRDRGFRAAYEDAEARSRVLGALVKIRQSLHLTQTQVAKRMQTTQSFVSELENGATDPHLSTLQRYARAVTARLLVKIEMPPDSPWLPADQGAYSGGSRVRIRTERPPIESSDLASTWKYQNLRDRGCRSGNV